jgi:ubiquinone biosynthesis protein COQ9
MAALAKLDEAQDWAKDAEARLLAEALRLAPMLGWTWMCAYAAGAATGLSRGDLELLAPHGPADLAALWSRACDQAMLARLAAADPTALKVRERVRLAVRALMSAALEQEAATRRWAGYLALPAHAPLGLRLAWESADAIWRWAGDEAADAGHFTKRALLAEILVGALAVGLARGLAAAETHVERRIEAVMAFERLKSRVGRWGLGRRTFELLGRARFGGLGGR